MTSFTDNLYLGQPNLANSGGAGPLGRIAFLNIVPLVLQLAGLVAFQNTVAATALTLVAGTGVTAGLAPDGSQRTVYQLDVPRSVSLSSASNFSAMNFTITAFDAYGRLETNTIAGPNGNTVLSTKAFKSVLSIVPSATEAVNSVRAGYGDKFGLPFAIYDAGYLARVGWAGALAEDAGTFVAGDATDPATASTTDPRGTYVPTSAADGARRLVIGMHLTEAQCGPSATMAAQIGIAPA